ncbi:unnamed protein product, partial [Mesorhabditis spiculigera]
MVLSQRSTLPTLPRQVRLSSAEAPQVVEPTVVEASSSEQTATSEPESAKESEAEVSDSWKERLSRRASSTEKRSIEITAPEILEELLGDEVHFMIESGMQTERSGFIRREEPQPQKSDDTVTEEAVRYMVNGATQTDSAYDTTLIQTEMISRIDMASFLDN